MILNAGRATLELSNPAQIDYIDTVETGRTGVSGHYRVAFEVDDCAAVTERLAAAGAELIAPPTRTPWDSLNARLTGPAKMQLTVFTELNPGPPIDDRGMPGPTLPQPPSRRFPCPLSSFSSTPSSARPRCCRC